MKMCLPFCDIEGNLREDSKGELRLRPTLASCSDDVLPDFALTTMLTKLNHQKQKNFCCGSAPLYTKHAACRGMYRAERKKNAAKSLRWRRLRADWARGKTKRRKWKWKPVLVCPHFQNYPILSGLLSHCQHVSQDSFAIWTPVSPWQRDKRAC